MAAVEFAGERAHLLQRAGVIGLGPRPTQPRLDRRTVALGEMVEHVALLVTNTPMDRDLAEHRADRLAQRLGAVEHEQDALLGILAPLDEVHSSAVATVAFSARVRRSASS
jgi:hypothetical protein